MEKKQNIWNSSWGKSLVFISKCVAKNVAERYRSLFNLNMAIQNGRTDELSEMVIEDAENNKSRKLGSVQMNKIVQIFMSTDPTEKLN